MNFYIIHNATIDGSEVIVSVPGGVTMYSINGAGQGTYVMAAVFAENVIGNSTKQTVVFCKLPVSYNIIIYNTQENIY